MTSVAIIGAGIAGLGTAYLLHPFAQITLFERDRRVGGHTNTIVVPEGERAVPVDTGFMVYNEVTYPQLCRLFAQLGVASQPTSMSFGVQDRASGIEYCGSSRSELFAQRRNLLRPRFLRMLKTVLRFNREAAEGIDDPRFASMSLDEYARARGYSDDFLRLYLLPMAAAVWSTPFTRVHEFPAVTLLRFFRNHGLLGGLEGHHSWLTVAGGAKKYVEAMTRDFRDAIVTGNAVVAVTRDAHGATVRLAGGERARFDKVVFACHADEALAILQDRTADEDRLLGAFRYQRNEALLHTDPAPMPRARRAWASWNVRVDGDRATTIYWMNRLQRVSERRDYFVSIDDPALVDPARVLRRIIYHHPQFDLRAVRAQAELPALNAIASDQTTYYCGAYFGYGFHEDGFRSAIDVSAAVMGRALWEERAA